MKKTIVVAIAENYVIGKENDLVWHMPADLKWFVKQTKGKWVIMGRKSWESINKTPLPGRTHIIVTRREDYQVPEGVYVVKSLEEGYAYAEKHGVEELMILGGGEIYRQAIKNCDRIILTEIHEEFEGDTFFPKINRSEWNEVFREDQTADENNPHDYSFVILESK